MTTFKHAHLGYMYNSDIINLELIHGCTRDSDGPGMYFSGFKLNCSQVFIFNVKLGNA